MSAPENPFAFPFPETRDRDGCGIMEGSTGMTLRDWFAGQALGAIIAAASSGTHRPGPVGDARPMTERIAHDAYCLADAMLDESVKERA